MAPPTIPDPATVPAHLLFPEQYEQSKQMIIRDFAVYGTIIISMVLGAAFLYASV